MTEGLAAAPSFAEFLANWPIFRDAVLTGTLAGALLGFLGVEVVLRRMVFASSAIAQAAALGVALSFWVAALLDPIRHAAGHEAGADVHVVSTVLLEPVLWAVGASLLATLIFAANPARLHLTRESLLGVVFLASGAATVIVGNQITQEAHDLSAILFGSAVVVRPMDLALIAGAAVLLIGAYLLLWRPLVFVAYDPVAARVQGLPVRRLTAFVFVAIGLAVALCTRALGALPVFAFSVLPAMTALVLTQRLRWVFALAALIGAAAAASGYGLAFRAELPVGATQSAMAVVILLVAGATRLLVRSVLGRRGRRQAG